MGSYGGLSSASATLSFRPRPSGGWSLVIGAAAVWAAVVLARSDPPLAVALPWLGAFAGAGLAAVRDQRRLRRIRRCYLHADGRIELQLGGGARVPARLAAGFAHPVLVVLRLRTVAGARYDLFLPRGGVPPPLHRQLRVWVVQHRGQQAALTRRHGRAASRTAAGVRAPARYWRLALDRARGSRGCSAGRDSRAGGRRSAR